MNSREEQCAFAKLNRFGRCIAFCHRRDDITGEDCVGLVPADEGGSGREVMITGERRFCA